MARGPSGTGWPARLRGALNVGDEARAGDALRRLVEAQATYRRLASLVAEGAPPAELFQAFAGELGELLPRGVVAMSRYGEDGKLHPVGTWSHEGDSSGTDAAMAPVTARPGGQGPGRPAPGAGAEPASPGPPATVQVPIEVEGRPWGAMAIWSADAALPVDADERLREFASLMATIIANAGSRAALAASRARIVAASDEARRRIERDLHDGAQQRLVSLALALRAAEAKVPAEDAELRSELSAVADGLTELLDELRTIARGVHPAVLDTGGLGPALRALGRRSPVPVQLDVASGRYPEQLEVSVYYVVSEALTNVAKHANASFVRVEVAVHDRALHVIVADDGVGGARLQAGSGLVGLRDRVEAVGGSLELHSLPGGGTSLEALMPLPGS